MTKHFGLSEEQLAVLRAEFREFKDGLREAQDQLTKSLGQHIDRQAAIMVFAGFPRGGKSLARQLAAMPLEKASVFLEEIGTIKADDMERIRQQLDQAMSVGRVKADDLVPFRNYQQPGSRRGRNIKPDESRKARYSQSRK